ncbi:hypothetical protein [Variovorax sp. DT-64]|uniref:hypothetical protein n=1 Tax=Variovorax sp. DT-64 TaxID=3396160 RepID=UPI003F1D4FC9
MLQQLHHLPSGFATTSSRDLHRVLPGPTLIHPPGEAQPPLFVSILLHGNQDVGLHALQSVLAKHAAKPLPRALSISSATWRRPRKAWAGSTTSLTSTASGPLPHP